MAGMNIRSAIKKINDRGALLVFPIKNKKEPNSLWAELFPRIKMRWEWSESGDDRVAQMWAMMKRLSDCKEVVYSKWHQGRATFFSREVFTAMLRLHRDKLEQPQLSMSAREILDALESDSPLSTKELKKITGLQGRDFEGEYNRAMKQLFKQLLIVGFGEVEDGAFPSLAVGATKNIYEDLWQAAQTLSLSEAQQIINRHLPEGSLFRKTFDKSFL